MSMTSALNGHFRASLGVLVDGVRRIGPAKWRRATRKGRAFATGDDVTAFADVAHQLLSAHAHTTGTVLATTFLEGYGRLPAARRRELLAIIARDFAPDTGRVVEACEKYVQSPDSRTMRVLQHSIEPPRQELFRRINQAPSGTYGLVKLREDVLRFMVDRPEFKVIDEDMVHLFQSWFNRGFLKMRRVDWSSPADLLEKIIGYEAVHSIGSWAELRQRLAPSDRRCYAFFHPAMPDEPLIFVEVALSSGIAASIQAVLADERAELPAHSADTAMFYSISNCQNGLQGVSFGHHLLQQVVQDLSSELPCIRTFATLSPVPGLVRWLQQEAAAGNERAIELAAFANAGEVPSDEMLIPAALHYLTEVTDKDGRAFDPVLRFHLGNGARLERLCPGGDRSPEGIRQSLGLMVNYRYDPASLETNRDAFIRNGRIAVGRPVQHMRGKTNTFSET